MKTYLTQFFEICEYDTADAQCFLELYDIIVSNSKANGVYLSYKTAML